MKRKHIILVFPCFISACTTFDAFADAVIALGPETIANTLISAQATKQGKQTYQSFETKIVPNKNYCVTEKITYEYDRNIELSVLVKKYENKCSEAVILYGCTWKTFNAQGCYKRKTYEFISRISANDSIILKDNIEDAKRAKELKMSSISDRIPATSDNWITCSAASNIGISESNTCEKRVTLLKAY